MATAQVTIRFRERGETVPLPIEVPLAATRLVLADADGREHHFGCGQWDTNGNFVHVATYTSAGREKLYWFDDILDAMKRGWRVLDEPQFGPRLPPLVVVALEDMARDANLVNGFIGYEKELAVRILRALWNEAREPLDAVEIETWAATHGWSLKQTEDLGELVEGVREGRHFRATGGGNAIARDPEREQKMVEGWRKRAGRSMSWEGRLPEGASNFKEHGDGFAAVIDIPAR